MKVVLLAVDAQRDRHAWNTMLIHQWGDSLVHQRFNCVAIGCFKRPGSAAEQE